MKLCFEKLKNYCVPICLIVMIIVCVSHFFAQSNEAVEKSTYKYLSGISASQSIAFNQKLDGMYSALGAFAAVDTQNSFVGISVPVYDGGRNVKGVLYASYRTQNFIQLLVSLAYG